MKKKTLILIIWLLIAVSVTWIDWKTSAFMISLVPFVQLRGLKLLELFLSVNRLSYNAQYLQYFILDLLFYKGNENICLYSSTTFWNGWKFQVDNKVFLNFLNVNLPVGGGQHRFATQGTFLQTFRTCGISQESFQLCFWALTTITGFTEVGYLAIRKVTRVQQIPGTTNIWPRFLNKVSRVFKVFDFLKENQYFRSPLTWNKS